jgi:acyl carrier protein
MLSEERIAGAVEDAIRTVLADRGETEVAFDATTALNAGIGLSSMDLAMLVAELEATTGLDPFARLVPITEVRRVGDLIEAYRRAAAGEEPAEDPGLAAAAARAQRRRQGRGTG